MRAWLLILLAGCAPDPITEVLVKITSDLAPSEIQGVRISINRAGTDGGLFDKCSCVGGTPECSSLPITLGVIPDGSAKNPFTVEAAAFSDAACGTKVVSQTATLQFYSRHTVELDMSLLEICKSKVCDPGSTCYDDGQCHPDQRNDLPPLGADLGHTSDLSNPDGGSGPAPRLQAAIAYDPVQHRTVMFGGEDLAENVFGDTWEWDGTRWVQTVASGDGPQKRFHGGMTWDPSRQAIVLYGGAYLPDTWTYSAGTWTRLPIPDGPDPEYPFLAYDSARQKLTLFDERGETEVLESGGWRKLTPAHTPSSGGIGAMAWDSARSQIVLFGGYDQQDNPTNDVWLWDGSDWTLSTAAPGPMPQFGASLVDDGSRLLLFGLGDTWQWTGSWKSVLVGMGPPQRTDAMMAYDSARGVTVLFGGDSGSTLYGDTWEFNGAWQKK